MMHRSNVPHRNNPPQEVETMPRRKITDDMRRQMERNRERAILDAGGGPMTGPKHGVGERVTSIAGWTGTVASVFKNSNGTYYAVRWDKSQKIGDVPACMLKP